MFVSEGIGGSLNRAMGIMGNTSTGELYMQSHALSSFRRKLMVLSGCYTCVSGLD